jgi:hypothetical protein
VDFRICQRRTHKFPDAHTTHLRKKISRRPHSTAGRCGLFLPALARRRQPAALARRQASQATARRRLSLLTKRSLRRFGFWHTEQPPPVPVRIEHHWRRLYPSVQ